MKSALAYWNGRLVPAAEVVIAPYDAGFVQGTTVGEQLRTFGGQLFRLEQHLERLGRSLAIVGVVPPVSLGILEEISRSLARYNHALLAPGDDLGLSIVITPGIYAAFAAGATGGPTVIVSTYPVAFGHFATAYTTGQALVVSPVRQVPTDCWPAELKCRSRMHYYLADRAARQQEPGARALLLDHDGYVTEASTANIVICERDGGLVSPPKERILPGISVATLAELADQLGLPFRERLLRVEDLEQAQEIFLTSTSPCLVPCTRLNGRPVGTGQPGPVFARLLAAWSARVGVDIAAQAKRFAQR
ncbi:MAG: aminotransferase class IV [Pirellulales bacterium]